MRPTVITTILLLAGCGDPCLPDVNPKGPIIAAEQCPPSDETSSTTSSSSSDSYSSSNATSSGESTSSDMCVVEPGLAWGPCVDVLTPNPLVEAQQATTLGCLAIDLFCIGGTICLPACDAEGCPDIGPGCSDGVCAANGACYAPCEIDDDCPVDGMTCQDWDFVKGCGW